MREPVGTLAGENTVLVLFEEMSALERWRAAILDLQRRAASGR